MPVGLVVVCHPHAPPSQAACACAPCCCFCCCCCCCWRSAGVRRWRAALCRPPARGLWFWVTLAPVSGRQLCLVMLADATGGSRYIAPLWQPSRAPLESWQVPASPAIPSIPKAGLAASLLSRRPSVGAYVSVHRAVLCIKLARLVV
jgi:hypothetical protein